MQKSKPISIQSENSGQTHEQQTQRQQKRIMLDVYYTAILKDPQELDEQSEIIRRVFQINENCYVFTNKENSRTKIARSKKQAINILHSSDYSLVTQIKFQQNDHLKQSFSFSKRLQQQTRLNVISSYFNLQKSSKQLDLNSLVFYSLKNNIFSQTNNQQIRNNDYLKFGKQIYSAKIYKSSLKKIKMIQNGSLNERIYRQDNQIAQQCKICLQSDGISSKDHIISPCKCSGSCSGIHIECLKKWIGQKIQVGKHKKDNKIKTYDMSKFSCEICKEQFPKIIQVKQEYLDIIPEISLSTDLLVLEKLFPSEQAKICHFVTLKRAQTLTIGRNIQNELNLDDMSVSRFHASIFKGQDDKYYVYDKDSRFGTFLSLKDHSIQNLTDGVLLTSRQTYRFKMTSQTNETCDDIDTEELSEQKINELNL